MTLPEFRGELPPRVAIIEDNDVERDAIARFLVDQGYRVDEAEDGIAGLKVMNANAPDAVVLDMDMPNMDGVNTLRRMRSSPALKGVYVVVTSGLVGARDRQRAFEAGCNQYIVKPFTLVSLGGALRTYFIKLGLIET